MFMLVHTNCWNFQNTINFPGFSLMCLSFVEIILCWHTEYYMRVLNIVGKNDKLKKNKY